LIGRFPRDIQVPCSVCGYDLRGQIEPRCPECGAEVDSLDSADWLEPAQKRADRICMFALVVALLTLGFGGSILVIAIDFIGLSNVLDFLFLTTLACYGVSICTFCYGWYVMIRLWRVGRGLNRAGDTRIAPILTVQMLLALVIAMPFLIAILP
jgi:hypothetical protein